jgi:hypothetical protein
LLKLYRTWIWHFNDLGFLDSWQLYGPDDRPELKSGEEVGQETEDVDADRLVHVDDVLQGEVAKVEGKSVTTKSLNELKNNFNENLKL